MKSRFFLASILALSSALCALSQIPQGFNYQAIARDGATGNPIINSTLKVKLSVLSDTTGFYSGSGGVYIWEEEHLNVQTNSFGMFTVVLGSPTAIKVQGSATTFSDIDWSAANLFVGTKIANPSDYKVMGSAKLWSVPYALRSKDSEQWQTSGSNIFRTTGNLGLGNNAPSYRLDVTGEITSRNSNSFRLRQNSFSTILRNDNTDFYLLLTNSGDPDGTWNTLRPFRVNLATGNTYVGNGALTVNHGGNVGIGTTSPTGRMVIQSTSTWDDNIPLFEVKNKYGTSVLAVYNNGVRILVEDTDGKGLKGGFAIGGFDPTKAPGAETVNLMMVTPDSVRINIDNNPAKAVKGGFAIGSFDASKAVNPKEFMNVTPQASSAGQYNTFIGYQAGKINTGQYNSFMGYQAGIKNTQGSSNVFLGYQSGYSNVGGADPSGSYNVFIGRESGFSNTAGAFNTFIGYKAGYSNSSGHHNVAIGYQAGLKNLNSRNVYIGYESGVNSTNGYNNVFLGYWAGKENTTGYDNVFLGTYSGSSNTTGLNNVFVGRDAGSYNQTGGSNVLIGSLTGYKSTSSYNTILGYRAGYEVTTGSSNVFLGTNAGEGASGISVTGSENVIIGPRSGQKISTGQRNVILGSYAGTNITSAQYCNIMGYYAGYNSTGFYNTFIGTYAGYGAASGATGSNNIFLGYNSGRNNANGGYGVFLGYRAGYNNSSGNDNIFIGNNAGNSNTTGTQNVYIGPNAGYSSNGSYNIFIGTTAGYYETGSDRLIITNTTVGNPLVWGDMANHRMVIYGTSSDNPNNRNFYVNGTAGGDYAWYNDSDEKLKKDIVTIPDALDKVMMLRGVNFRWKEPADGMESLQMGFIGQEAEKVIPEVVSVNNDSYSMQYAPITALLVEAVKEQQSIIEEQKNRIKILEEKLTEIESLKERIAAIEALAGNK